jgi:predicted RNase H-like HicB family nuclease
MINSTTVPKAFTVIVRPCTDMTGYWATCEMPDGGCTTQGKSLKEIQKNILEAVAFYLEDYPEISDYYLKLEVYDA